MDKDGFTAATPNQIERAWQHLSSKESALNNGLMDTEMDEPAVSEPPIDFASPVAMEVDETADVEPTNNSAGTRYLFNSKTPAHGNERGALVFHLVAAQVLHATCQTLSAISQAAILSAAQAQAHRLKRQNGPPPPDDAARYLLCSQIPRSCILYSHISSHRYTRGAFFDIISYLYVLRSLHRASPKVTRLTPGFR